ncbi:hypothetical protein KP509_20G025500 [Ceratopteris richardii]|uniref:Uncharacterized protein n=1 Tax=Ceratopteris richardii TaxID=49495 RepID=A0A8T2SG15_CERRI|nr:hypothetical protein KP509_20G025500 [Ceratopteris richardii]KAH7331305.1 hypothetical protein KP509_20G025500 [Ceratopteris richardii]KAH7331306.1 hypothetical protein KP509_20G025500 [Ceratopteris richardii]KAH7331307.1 hypothetical protein KP509_20G025500 [Ceratopteris richardii]
MVGKGPDDNADYCKFPNVRKNFWRSATWNAGKASSLSSNTPVLDVDEAANINEGRNPPQTPRSQEHTSSLRARTPHLPLQPLTIARRSCDSWPSTGLDDCPDLVSPVTPGRRRVKAGLDIKLDLASVHRSIVEPTEIQLRRDKFALYDKQCSRVAKYHIYLGSDAIARDLDILQENRITHVLNCVGFVCPEYFKQDLEYKTLWLQDNPCEDLISLLYDVFDYFEEVREQGGRVFVHCCQGVSRSTSLVIAYIMWREHKSFEEAFQDVKAARGVANPNMGFACQLLQCQRRMHAAPMSPKSVPRMYRLAPHSAYDPLHLVLKSCVNPGPGLLDSRGAFVIHAPSFIFLWIGQSCDSKMAQEAEETLGQIVRYEKAEASVRIYIEGNEGTDFWNCFTDHSLPCEKELVGNLDNFSSESAKKPSSQYGSKWDSDVAAGSRKVSSNDADYCMYQLARQGGVIPPFPFNNGAVDAMPVRIPVHDDGWSVLRRKASSRKLLDSKHRFSFQGRISNVFSPNNISMGSSSPNFSPFSFSSTSSSTPAGSDSSFDSPLSSMGVLSPINAETGTTASIGCSSPSIGILQIVSHSKAFANAGGCKGLQSSLAERRGSLPPRLQLPNSEDMPPPAPRGASRKPRLPPLVMTEDHAAKNTKKDCKDKNVDSLVTAEKLASAQYISLARESSCIVACDKLHEQPKCGAVLSTNNNPPVKRTPENDSSFLYVLPELERISLFDADDLDTKGVFLLLESGCLKKDSHQKVVHIWVGQQQAGNKEVQDSDADKEWHQVGQEYVSQLQLPNDTPIHVVREGYESDEFWEAFNRGCWWQ